MTMVPAQNHLSTHHLCGGYVGGCGGAGRYGESFGGGGGGDHLMNGGRVCVYSSTALTEYYYYYSCLGSDHRLRAPPMAEDESTTNSLNEEAASNRDDGWLQLSIGGGGGGGKYDQPRRSSGLVELDLLPGGGGGAAGSQDSRTPADYPLLHSPQIPANSRWVSNFLSPPTHNFGDEAAAAATTTATPLFSLFSGTSGSSNFVQQEINWAFRPMAGVGVGVAGQVRSSSPSTSSSSSFLAVGGRRSSYLGRPLIQFQTSGVDAAGPSSDVRIINPPRRPHSGIWFTLKALENQVKEPFLPQISKNYLRIKNERMTVRLVMKYLVNKLHLDSESEVEIRCRGQELLPFWTLQHVRDSIWTSSSSSSSDSLFTLLPDSSTTHHLMLLHYGRKD